MAEHIYEAVRHQVRRRESQPFLRTLDRTISYQEFSKQVDRYAAGFAAMDPSPEGGIGLFLNNRPEFLYALIGAQKQGIPVSCLNSGMRGSGLNHLIESSGIDVLLSRDNLLHHVDSEQVDRLSLTPKSDYLAIDDIVSNQIDGDTTPPANIQPTELAVRLHTSGTTGLPKWCNLSHEYFLALGEFIADGFEITPSDTVFNPLPMYHINPLGYSVFGGLMAGATLGMTTTFSASNFWSHAKQLDATVVILHIAPANMVAERTTVDDAAGHSIRIMFPANREFMNQFDVPKMVTGYGSTEAAGLTHINKFTRVPENLPTDEKLSQCTGFPRRDVSCRIVNDRGQEVPQGRRGEILIRPERPGVLFSGYANAEKTVEAWRQLWYNTGDLGYIDDDGGLHFIGRKTDSVSHKGEFVNVELVESTLESHPGVTGAIIVGIPDDIVGERVKAYLKAEDDLAPEEILESVEPDLPTYMVPEYVEFIESFPRVEGTEKINRSALRERGLNGAWQND